MDLTKSTEADLLAAMTCDAPSADARRAWEELYVRHRRYFFVVVSRCYRTALDEDGAIDLVVDTFRRAYEWARRQKSADVVRECFIGINPDSTRRRVLGWLGAIAQQLFRDRFRERALEAAAFSEFLGDQARGQEDASDDSVEPPPPRLESALAMLNAADADALRLSLPWYDIDSQSFAMPRGEAARVAARIGVSVDALRQRRHRAIKKLEQYMQGAETAEGRGGVAQ
jgi:DNA-directed RNA polymerase specialized sigma24 family protein